MDRSCDDAIGAVRSRARNPPYSSGYEFLTVGSDPVEQLAPDLHLHSPSHKAVSLRYLYPESGKQSDNCRITELGADFEGRGDWLRLRRRRPVGPLRAPVA